jgi:hypothetical protein
LEICIRKIVHYGFLKRFAQIHHVKGNFQPIGDPPSIKGIVEPAAPLGIRTCAGRRVVELHVHADDLVPLLAEKPRDDGRVYASRHGNNDAHRLTVLWPSPRS